MAGPVGSNVSRKLKAGGQVGDEQFEEPVPPLLFVELDPEPEPEPDEPPLLFVELEPEPLLQQPFCWVGFSKLTFNEENIAWPRPTLSATAPIPAACTTVKLVNRL